MCWSMLLYEYEKPESVGSEHGYGYGQVVISKRP